MTITTKFERQQERRWADRSEKSLPQRYRPRFKTELIYNGNFILVREMFTALPKCDWFTVETLKFREILRFERVGYSVRSNTPGRFYQEWRVDCFRPSCQRPEDALVTWNSSEIPVAFADENYRQTIERCIDLVLCACGAVSDSPLCAKCAGKESQRLLEELSVRLH